MYSHVEITQILHHMHNIECCVYVCTVCLCSQNSAPHYVPMQRARCLVWQLKTLYNSNQINQGCQAQIDPDLPLLVQEVL